MKVQYGRDYCKRPSNQLLHETKGVNATGNSLYVSDNLSIHDLNAAFLLSNVLNNQTDFSVMH